MLLFAPHILTETLRDLLFFFVFCFFLLNKKGNWKENANFFDDLRSILAGLGAKGSQ